MYAEKEIDLKSNSYLFVKLHIMITLYIDYL